MYNVIFTVLPPFVIGVFDQFVSARILDRYPQLYMLGQRNVFFTKTAFWLWVGNALYHSIVSGDQDGTKRSVLTGTIVAYIRVLSNPLLGRSEAVGRP